MPLCIQIPVIEAESVLSDFYANLMPANHPGVFVQIQREAPPAPLTAPELSPAEKMEAVETFLSELDFARRGVQVNKIAAIKALRAMTGANLKDAKEKTEELIARVSPPPFKTGV